MKILVINMSSNNENEHQINDGLQGGPLQNVVVPAFLMILRGCNTNGYELIQQLIKFGFDSIH
jgi:PadR family transcriptional regulator, regulatory protein PadR